jgi:hypothetical protein
MPNDDLEATKKKVLELEAGLSQLTDHTFAYFTAILQLLQDRGIVERKQMIRWLEWYKKRYAEASRDLEFFNLMQQLGEDEGRSE